MVAGRAFFRKGWGDDAGLSPRGVDGAMEREIVARRDDDDGDVSDLTSLMEPAADLDLILS
jgi:hypothetical protein